MSKCLDCGARMGLLDPEYQGKCIACNNLESSVESGPAQVAKKEEDKRINQILLTTETSTDLKIRKRIEIVTAECAYGMNIFKDIFSGVRDIVGGRSDAVQDTLRDARKTVLYELKKEAHLIGANAVVGVDLDYSELSGGGSKMLFLVATGTAVQADLSLS